MINFHQNTPIKPRSTKRGSKFYLFLPLFSSWNWFGWACVVGRWIRLLGLVRIRVVSCAKTDCCCYFVWDMLFIISFWVMCGVCAWDPNLWWRNGFVFVVKSLLEFFVVHMFFIFVKFSWCVWSKKFLRMKKGSVPKKMAAATVVVCWAVWKNDSLFIGCHL